MAKEKAVVAVVDETPSEGGSYIRQPDTGALELQARTEINTPVDQAIGDSQIDFNA